MFFFVICPMDFPPRVEFELQKTMAKILMLQQLALTGLDVWSTATKALFGIARLRSSQTPRGSRTFDRWHCYYPLR